MNNRIPYYWWEQEGMVEKRIPVSGTSGSILAWEYNLAWYEYNIRCRANHKIPNKSAQFTYSDLATYLNREPRTYI